MRVAAGRESTFCLAGELLVSRARPFCFTRALKRVWPSEQYGLVMQLVRICISETGVDNLMT